MIVALYIAIALLSAFTIQIVQRWYDVRDEGALALFPIFGGLLWFIGIPATILVVLTLSSGHWADSVVRRLRRDR